MTTVIVTSLSLSLVLSLIFGYAATLSVYRLFFHPLARLPGPPLARLTFYYTFYYDVILKGQLTFHIRDLHKRYGPIVRVTPDEVHISDPDFFDELYTKHGCLDRDLSMTLFLGNDTGIFTTTSGELHKVRKSPIAPLFSRRRILELEPIIRDKITELTNIIRRFRANGKVLVANRAFMSLTEDIISQYCFGKNKGKLSAPEFGESIDDAFRALIAGSYLSVYFPWIPKIMKALPPSVATLLTPPLSILFAVRRDIESMVRDVQSGRDKNDTNNDHASVIQKLTNSHLPPQERTLLRITDEAFNLLNAGVTTSGWTVTVATYHIISRPRVSAILREELRSNFPDFNTVPGLLELEKLKYLRACVNESLRLGIGESSKSQRIPRQGPVHYMNWIIPQNSTISMTKCDVISDARLFPNPDQFIPERWIDHVRYNGGVNPNDYLVVFGRGARSCVGRELAYAEIFHMLAALFREFEFELYETDESDVKFMHDYLIPLPKLDSKGVRVKVVA